MASILFAVRLMIDPRWVEPYLSDLSDAEIVLPPIDEAWERDRAISRYLKASRN